MGIGDLCRLSPAIRYGRVSQSSGTGPCGVCIRGKFVLSTNPRYTTRNVAILLNIVLTPG